MNNTVKLKNGIVVPALGQGTWYLGDSKVKRKDEIEAVQTGIDLGMTLIDTAEMYGSGRSEELVGEAIKDFDREKLFLVSKVLPSNANRANMRRVCENSIKRMKASYLDLYLYHWRGGTPLKETVDCLEELVNEGLIKSWGVSNFDIDDMEELYNTPNGKNCMVNQVLYHTGSRGIEYSLLPWMVENNISLMSYCPLAQAGSLRRGLFNSEVLKKIAKKHECDITQVMLAWNIRNGKTIAIPRTGNKVHTILNAGADKISLDEDDFKAIDNVFTPPTRKEPLDIQ
mgnify:FL=1|jgi:aldo/keto reductase family oxidoreductase